MAYTLQQLSDFEDIRTLKHRYFRAIDTADLDLLASVLSADVDIDYRGGGYRVKLKGRENLIDFIANAFSEGLVAMHQGHNPEITLTGEDSAEGIWYLEDVVLKLPENRYVAGSALYRDVYRREDGQWKIARSEYDRVVEFSWPIPPDLIIHAHYLAQHGRKLKDLTDVSHLISYDDMA